MAGVNEAALADAAFSSNFDRLKAIVQQRLEIQWSFHRRDDIERMKPELLELVRDFGELLRVVYRHGLTEELGREAAWYASVLASRGPGEDAFGLLVDSWIVAIEGVLRSPECNVLAAPLKALRSGLPRLFAQEQARPDEPANPAVRALVERLTVGDRRGAEAVLRGPGAAGRPVYEDITHAILPALAEIGRRWERNELAIHEEHLATETIVRVLAGLVTAGSAEPTHGTALVSCVPKDEHQVLPMALGAYLELRGWSVRSLGRGLPACEVALAADALNPDAIFLSVAMLSRLSDALDVIALLRRAKGDRRVFTGGRGAELGRTLLESAGAPVVTSFEEAHRRASAGDRLA
jgi:methanogenic corrinoid protein MtbC1